MSDRWPIVGRCGYCGKICRDKPLIGTMHICLTEGERAQVDCSYIAARHAMRAQQQMINDGYVPFSVPESYLSPPPDAPTPKDHRR